MQSRSTRFGAALTAVVAVTALAGYLVVAGERTALAASAVTIDGARTHQRIDGFGMSEAFGQANAIRNLGDTALRKQVLDLLFSETNGAGFSILRNLIPSDPSHTMLPNAPSGPSATPAYVWNGADDATDWGQLWLTKQARGYGVSTIYNDAWSAPGFMKTNNDEANGGTLCGVPGASCASGDWRQAYANYLVQNVKNYASVGITVPYLGFLNEPTWTTGYSSMLINPTQAADFTKVLANTIRSAGLSTKIVCCETLGWNNLPGYTNATLGDSAAAAGLGVFSSHGYASAPNSVVNTGGKPVWQTEWSHGQGTFNAAWDDNTAQSGFRWAQNIHNGLVNANLNAFLYWWGISNSTNSNSALIQLSGTTLNFAKRYYSFVNYSRFIRPGAVRIGASTADADLKVSAYKNTDGSVVIVALNSATSATQTSFTLPGTGITTGSATPYLTNGSSNTARRQPIAVTAGGFGATLPGRSLVTYTIPAGGSQPSTSTTTSASATTTTPPGGDGCTASVSLNSWNGGFVATVKVTAGASAVNGWRVALTLPSGTAVTNTWNAVAAGSTGTVQFTNTDHNGRIAAGQSAEFGFQATGSGSGLTPACSAA
ncbi:hypothetical protein ALI22I_42420 [Saccharothrix sp. ALI-22-I]|uniref:cellulose binding domain-containing protein n=1 Tax=Saccharothrix sp. ALI-22-I TaxID=1933778 RepID=UPI00097C903E|nr:glycoside hydrolase [Saccharothrix sp. ALI-22-I]ONI80088.1 hypothetical protein ALI22I_42420 [Saccharothrix sp. ALI-22-I]